MRSSDCITDLAAALVAVQAEIKNPANTAINPFFKSKYAPLPDILNEVRPLLTKHGLAAVQETMTDRATGYGCVTIIVHKGGQWMELGPTLLKPVKDDPQGAGSCYSYSRRYSLSAALAIASEDDDDANAATHNGDSRKNDGAAQSIVSMFGAVNTKEEYDAANAAFKAAFPKMSKEQQIQCAEARNKAYLRVDGNEAANG